MNQDEFRQEFPPAEPPPGPERLVKPDAKQATIENVMGQRYSVDEVEACLLRFQGKQNLVASHLMLASPQLKAFMKANVQLHKWIPVKIAKGKKIIPALKLREEQLKVPAFGGSELPPSIPETVKIDELVEQVKKEDERIRKGLITLGASEAKAQEMLEVGANFRVRHIDKALGFTAVGVALNFTNQLDILRDLEKRIQQRGVSMPDGTIRPFACNCKGDPVEEAMVLEAYVAISEESRRTAEMYMKAQVAIARIQAMKKDQSTAKAGGPPKGKVSFPTKAIMLASAGE